MPAELGGAEGISLDILADKRSETLRWLTATTAIALGLEAYDPRRIHLATVGAAEIAATAEKLAAMTVAERAALPVMAKGREDVIAAGALLLDELVRRFQIQRVVASEADILDGVLLGLAEGTHGG
jgi:exopolyphosphatase/guanosine-5'-triphosphate,3'-diphosphate pyrophosphatase